MPRAPGKALPGGQALRHWASVALVPPAAAWGRLQAARLGLRDPGLWRWPPHVNVCVCATTQQCEGRGRRRAVPCRG